MKTGLGLIQPDLLVGLSEAVTVTSVAGKILKQRLTAKNPRYE
jgi:hypothetical protein